MSSDLLLIVGACLLVVGVALLSMPVGLIAGGVIFMLFGAVIGLPKRGKAKL